MTISRLWDHHLADLRASGLSDETIAAALLYSATEAQVRHLLSFGRGPGLAFPYLHTAQDGGEPFTRVKADRPDSGGKRYCQRKGSGNRLYLPPMLDPAVLRNPGITLYVTEGEKKSLKAVQDGLACVSISGVDSWRSRTNGKSQPIQDLDLIEWRGRQVFIVYDSDIVSKAQVKWAEWGLARELARRGAKVMAIRLPGGPNGEKVGLDDYLNAHSVDAFCQIEPTPIAHPSGCEAGPGSGIPDSDASASLPAEAPDADFPPFPERAYVGVAGEFADLYAAYVESPKPFLYVAYLTYLGAFLGSSVTLETELRPSPRLYTVLVGESALGRKSASMGHVDRFFEPLLRERVAILYGLGSAEGIARVIKQKGLPVLLYFDELKAFVDKAKQEGSVALPMVTTLFEFTKYENHTRDRSIEVENAHLSLLAASTRETYGGIWTAQFLDIGFLNRLLIVTARRTTRRAFPAPIPTTLVEGLRAKTKEQLEEVWRLEPQPSILRLTPGAFERWKTWYEGLEDSLYANRLDTIGLRLMIIFTITTGKGEVDEEIVNAVVALLDYELAVRKLLDPIDAENAIARMEERIRRALQRGRMKKRTLAQWVHAHRVGTWVFNTALKNLLREGEIDSKGGREFWLNPDGRGDL